jgi:holliday junction DNA helicase RuvA
MFEYLNGIITDVKPGYIVVEVSGIGYLVYTPDPYQFKIDSISTVKVYIHQVVTDNSQLLYGFIDGDTKMVFEKLLNVSGIGPKSALSILAGNDFKPLIQAINNEDVTYLTKFPGVGKKTAKQIILDLKGKLDDIVSSDIEDVQKHAMLDGNQALSDALAALETLGYSSRDVKKAKKLLLQTDVMTTDEYLSQALKVLTQF